MQNFVVYQMVQERQFNTQYYEQRCQVVNEGNNYMELLM